MVHRLKGILASLMMVIVKLMIWFLIKLTVVAFQYLILFHERTVPYQVTQLEENVGILIG